jgi:hypothetical protein
VPTSLRRNFQVREGRSLRKPIACTRAPSVSGYACVHTCVLAESAVCVCVCARARARAGERVTLNEGLGFRV